MIGKNCREILVMVLRSGGGPINEMNNDVGI
jgi:hypothetical protein